MGKTSNEAKQNWNSVYCAQIKVSVKPETAAAFKSACEAAGVSMASAISGFMQSYAASPAVKASLPQVLTDTRRHRHNALRSLLPLLQRIRDSEERCKDSIPENLVSSTFEFVSKKDNNERGWIICA